MNLAELPLHPVVSRKKLFFGEDVKRRNRGFDECGNPAIGKLDRIDGDTE
jgi:hypothetical protein